MGEIRIRVPDVILEGVRERFCGGGKRYSDAGLRLALDGFVRSKSKEKITDDVLLRCLTYFSIKENQPSIDSIQRLFNRKEGKGIYLKDERNLPNLVCYYAFGESWFHTLKRYGFQEDDLIQKRINDSTQPQLTIFNEKKYSIKTLFKSRYIPFHGREDELSFLTGFWNDKSNFTWWLIYGTAGSGKSKLALAFSEKLVEEGVHAGFFDCSSINSYDWQNWAPKQHTFIVFDYAATNYFEILQILKLLDAKQSGFSYKVRVLLLEREIDNEWWKYYTQLLNIGEIKIWNKPLEIAQLDETTIKNIFQSIFIAENITRINENSAYELFKSIDKNSRPLFVILAGLLLAENKNLSGIRYKDLLKLYFDREAIILNKFCRNRNISSRILEVHKNLAAFSTIIRGIDNLQMESILVANYNWLPDESVFSYDLFQLIADIKYNENKISLGFIEPDIIGELFVVNQIFFNLNNALNSNKIISDLIAKSWEFSKAETSVFLQRVLQDFPEYYKQVNSFFLSTPISILASTFEPLGQFLKICCRKDDNNLTNYWYAQLKQVLVDVSDGLTETMLFVYLLNVKFRKQIKNNNFAGIEYFLSEIELIEDSKINQHIIGYHIDMFYEVVLHFCTIGNLEKATLYYTRFQDYKVDFNVLLQNKANRMKTVAKSYVDRLEGGTPFVNHANKNPSLRP